MHDIERIDLDPSKLNEGMRSIYGVDMGAYHLHNVGEDGAPLVRSKDELQIFRKHG